MDEQNRNLTPESRLSTADLAAKNPATDHEPVQSETTSRHETSSPVMQASRVEGQTLVARDGAAASEDDQGTREQRTTAGRSASGAGSDPEATPLFAEHEATQFRDRWGEVQAGFVDEPRRAVEQADGLVAETELSVLGSQCLDRRIPDKGTLVREVTAWSHDRNVQHSTIDWRFTTPDARIKLKRSTRRS